MTKNRSLALGEKGLWWPDTGNLWAEGGTVSLGRTKDQFVAHQRVADYETGGLFYCAGCDQKTEKESTGGRHFAGVYCRPCWVEYKQKNSRKCGLCGLPLYACHC